MNEAKNKGSVYDVIIAGGGLAGLCSAIVLARANKKVLLIEKKEYPHHKVCGEYISNEVLSYLSKLGFDPFIHGAAKISTLRISATNGKNYFMPLDLGGFGISRYTLDHALYQLAIQSGAKIITNTRVTDITFSNQVFTVKTNDNNTRKSKLVIGSYGKREVLDKKLGRTFIDKRSGYMAVKYHIRTDYPADEIGLDNFKGGYCGISMVEGDRYNLCYLYQRSSNPPFRSIKELEENVLYKNPNLKRIFTQSEFLFDAPEVINEISFAPKSQIENHILMCGDTSGLITPLCGNGMSMAIAASKMLTSLILESEILNKDINCESVRMKLESDYQKVWKQLFQKRLFAGRTIQHFFGHPMLTNLSLKLLHSFPVLERKIISATHGDVL
ncbi:MAG: NAD(P)/FAD-dependent oxidoreductase [Chitinophagaceae bacterium]|jgi:flavin-dependent dehydrogenase